MYHVPQKKTNMLGKDLSMLSPLFGFKEKKSILIITFIALFTTLVAQSYISLKGLHVF